MSLDNIGIGTVIGYFNGKNIVRPLDQEKFSLVNSQETINIGAIVSYNYTSRSGAFDRGQFTSFAGYEGTEVQNLALQMAFSGLRGLWMQYLGETVEDSKDKLFMSLLNQSWTSIVKHDHIGAEEKLNSLRISLKLDDTSRIESEGSLAVPYAAVSGMLDTINSILKP